MDIAARLGYDGVDVAVHDARDVQRLADLLEGTTLAVGALMTGPLWTSERLSLSDPATAGDACRRIAEIAEQAAELGAAVILGSVLGWVSVNPASRLRAQATLRASLQDVAGLGVPLMIEPLNRYESNVAPTAADARALADACGPAHSVVLDCFHANIEETDPHEAARIAASRVGLVHLSDSNRRMPGDGHFPIDAWIGALRAGGYRGAFTVEATFGPDAEADARRALAFCRDRGL
jgi:sugar phosphate isomerase/epimerase